MRLILHLLVGLLSALGVIAAGFLVTRWYGLCSWSFGRQQPGWFGCQTYYAHRQA